MNNNNKNRTFIMSNRNDSLFGFESTFSFDILDRIETYGHDEDYLNIQKLTNQAVYNLERSISEATDVLSCSASCSTELKKEVDKPIERRKSLFRCNSRSISSLELSRKNLIFSAKVLTQREKSDYQMALDVDPVDKLDQLIFDTFDDCKTSNKTKAWSKDNWKNPYLKIPTNTTNENCHSKLTIAQHILNKFNKCFGVPCIFISFLTIWLIIVVHILNSFSVRKYFFQAR